MQELNDDFIADGGTFKQCQAKDYFTVKCNPQLNKDSFVFNNTNEYPYFTRTVLNNGILGYVDYLDEEHKIKGNSIAVGMLGMQFFYMEKDFYAGQFTKTIFPKFDGLNATNAQYFISWFNKSSLYYASKLVRDFETLFNNTVLLLPFKDNVLSLDYMEKYIRELELARIRELELARIRELIAYLEVCGFKDYTLSKEELSAIDKFTQGRVKYKNYMIGKLFNIHPTKSYGYTNTTLFEKQGNVPVVVNSSMSNGIGGYVDRKPTEQGNMITFSDTTTSDAIFYQPDDFIGYSHVQGLYPLSDNNDWKEETLLYFLSCFRKSAKGRFDYATKFNRKIAMGMNVCLPVDDRGKIDYKFMETYIRAIEKQCIKNVVAWKDKIIQTTKEVVG